MSYKYLFDEIILVIRLINISIKLIYMLFKTQLYFTVKTVHIQYVTTTGLIFRRENIAVDSSVHKRFVHFFQQLKF